MRTLLLCAGFMMIIPPVAAADEIHYQTIESVFAGDSIIIHDNGPHGEEYYLCDIEGGCADIENDTARDLTTLQAYMGSVSEQGRYATLQIPVGTGALLLILDIEGGFAIAGSVPIVGTVVEQAFSPDETTFIAITADGTVTAHDLATEETRTTTIAQTELPFFRVSYGGDYLSAYSYANGAHRIWSTHTGDMTEVAGAPSYVEFNESETEAAFLVENDGHRNLSVASGFGEGVLQTEQVASGSFTVEDYLYVGDKLFYMANAESPLTWSIYQGDDDAPIVAEGASYGDYMKRIDGKLAYLKIEGKNANVYLYDPASGTHTRLDAAPQSEAEPSITRDEIEIAGVTAALLAPEDPEDDANLFIWLHGGPQRQTSLGYHPYLSYAVYDELLEKLAAGGNHVLKLDYSGSYGYGEDFLERLNGRVGTIEIDDVEQAIDEFTETHDIDNVYLIGNSYGGYMAFRALNDHYDDIDGIVAINGVSDWYGLITTIPSSPFSQLFNGSPNQQNLELYRNASVFTNVGEIDDETPILVFYGTEDKTVPTRESTEYVEFMRANDKNVTLTAFEGEEHVLRERETLTELCEGIADGFSLENVSCE